MFHEMPDNEPYMFKDKEVLRTLRTVPDQHTVRVPMMLMDGQSSFIGDGHRPGSLVMTDDQRQAKLQAHDAYEAWLGSAWKTTDADPATTDNTQASGRTAIEDAYARRDKALSEAWRNA
jgi:hypothetical protein